MVSIICSHREHRVGTRAKGCMLPPLRLKGHGQSYVQLDMQRLSLRNQVALSRDLKQKRHLMSYKRIDGSIAGKIDTVKLKVLANAGCQLFLIMGMHLLIIMSKYYLVSRQVLSYL